MVSKMLSSSQHELRMVQRSKTDLTLLNLIADFEHSFEKGGSIYLDEKSVQSLIAYYEKNQLFERALDVIDIALHQFPFNIDYLLIKARLLFQYEDLEQCAETLSLAENLNPSDLYIKLYKVKVLAKQKNLELANEVLTQIKDTDNIEKNYIDILVAESYINEASKNFEAMYFALKRALRLNPMHEEALSKFWDAVDLARKYEDSISFHKDLIDEHPYNYLAWFNLGMSFSFAWEYEKAIDALEYAFIINADFEQAYIECAELCVQCNMHKKALDIYLEAYRKFGQDPELMHNLANCYIKTGSADMAKFIIQKAIKIDPYNDELYFLLGHTFVAKKNWYSAINSYLKAIELDDSREEYYLEIAKCYVNVEDYTKASINFHKATNIASEDTLYWTEYISFLIKLRLFDEALQLLDEAEDTTFGADLLYCRAIALMAKKQKRAALDILAEALEEDFSKHGIIFELSPELEIDKEICSMIRYYESELQEYM